MKVSKKLPDRSRYSVWDKFNTTRKEIKSALVEMDEEIDISLTSLVGQYHTLFVGIPGTAKSLLALTIRNWLSESRLKTIHCCKDTSRNMAFGPVRMSALKDDRIDRVLEGGIADAHIVLLEECYKAGPAVLDMFLMLMNERVYEEGQVSRKCPLRFLMGVSNEWSPEGCETALAAFFDRFLFRKEVKPVSSYSGIRKLCGIPMSDPDESDPHSCEPELTTSLSLDELDLANKAANSLTWSKEAHGTFFQIHDELTKEGIVPGPRRLKQSVKACQAYAWLNGAEEVAPEHLEILKHILWMDPIEQPAKAAKIINQLANPLLETINGYGSQAEEIFQTAMRWCDEHPGVDSKHFLTETTSKLKDIMNKLEVTKHHRRLDEVKEEVEEYIGRTSARYLGHKSK